MKKVSKNLSVLLLVLVMIVSIVGCSSQPAKEEPSTDQTEKKTEEPKEEAKEIIELEFWDISTEGNDQLTASVQDAIKTIESERPEIKINLSTATGDAYKTKIKTAVAANEMPDMFYTWLPGYSQPFVESGSLLKLDDYLSQDAKDNMNMQAIQSGNGTYDGIYALPIEVKMGVLYCNGALFDEYGIKIPDTYDELLQAVDAFNAEGIAPIVAPGKRIWPVMWLYDIIATQTVGAEEAANALKKETSFDQQGYMDAALKLKELVDANAFVEGAVGLDNPEADAEFTSGNVPMYFMGTWAASNFSDPKNPVSEKLTVRKFPGMGAGYDNDVLGGTGDGYVVSSTTENPEAAVWAMERYTKLRCESDTTLFPVWDVEKDFSDMPPVYNELYDLYTDSEGFIIWWDTYMTGDDAQTHKNLVLELFAGAKTPEEFIEGMIGISNNK